MLLTPKPTSGIPQCTYLAACRQRHFEVLQGEPDRGGSYSRVPGIKGNEPHAIDTKHSSEGRMEGIPWNARFFFCYNGISDTCVIGFEKGERNEPGFNAITAKL